MKSPLALYSFAFVLSLTFAGTASAQSTGMGVVLKDPTPRDPDPRVILASDPNTSSTTADLKRMQAERARRQAEVLASCNQILILSHELHMKLLEPATGANLPSNSAMTSKIAELAKKVQKDMQAR